VIAKPRTLKCVMCNAIYTSTAPKSIHCPTCVESVVLLDRGSAFRITDEEAFTDKFYDGSDVKQFISKTL